MITAPRETRRAPQRARVEGAGSPARLPELAAGEIESRRLPLSLITPSNNNPRLSLDRVDELAASMREHGLLQPIVVRPQDGRYTIVAGHRRFAAAQSLGWTDIPVVVREVPADDAYVLTLVENLQRDDLSPKEEAEALGELVRTRNWSTHQVASAIKRSQAFVSKRIRVFDDPILRPVVIGRKLSISAAEELLTVDEPRRRALVAEAVAEQWERADVRRAVRGQFAANRPKKRGPRTLKGVATELRAMLRQVPSDRLSEAERGVLRRLFLDLSLIARASGRLRGVPAIPPLPK